MNKVKGRPKFVNGKLLSPHSGKYKTKAEENREHQFKEVLRLMMSTEEGKNNLRKLGIDPETNEKCQRYKKC